MTNEPDPAWRSPSIARRVLGVVLLGVGVLILTARAQQWADLLAADDPLPGTRYARSLTDVLAIGLVSVGVPMSRGVSADQMTAPVALGPWRVPRWTIVPMIAIVGFLLAVAVFLAFSS